jgi:hypothetical protein
LAADLTEIIPRPAAAVSASSRDFVPGISSFFAISRSGTARNHRSRAGLFLQPMRDALNSR